MPAYSDLGKAGNLVFGLLAQIHRARMNAKYGKTNPEDSVGGQNSKSHSCETSTHQHYQISNILHSFSLFAFLYGYINSGGRRSQRSTNLHLLPCHYLRFCNSAKAALTLVSVAE